MDDTDLAILREMYTDRVFRLGGADPRISHSEIAARLRLPKSTVTDRLRSWTETGFFQGFMILPNPRLFGLGLFGQTVVVDTAARREEVLRLLPTVPGTAIVYEAATALDFWLGYLGPDPDVVTRGRSILCAHPGVRATKGAYEYPLPECAVEPTHLDWRIIQALRAAPTAPLGDVASSLSIGYRTFSRRFDRLLRGLALLYAPRLDFSRAGDTLVEVELHLAPGAIVEAIWGEVDRVNPVVLRHYPWSNASGLWPFVDAPVGTELLTWGPCLQFLTRIRSPGEALKLQSRAERWPGVRRVFVNLLVSLWDIPAAFDTWIEAKIQET